MKALIENNQNDTPSALAEPDPITIRVATIADAKYAFFISQEMADSAAARGSGIGRRPISFLCEKMENGDAVIAITKHGKWVGFCYIETWEDGKFVSNSGMIVSPAYRKQGVATEIKKVIFDLCRQHYPKADIFSITTGLAIMKLNSKMGFIPVTYSEITSDVKFWSKCQHCVNYNTLTGKAYKNCYCTAMLFEANSTVPASPDLP